MANKQSLADLGKVEAIRQLFDTLPFRLKEGRDPAAAPSALPPVCSRKGRTSISSISRCSTWATSACWR